MSDADMKAMQSYQLTASGLTKYTRAVHNMIQVTKAHPEIAKEEDGSKANSLADIAAIYDRHPEVKRAITSAGMSSRDFVLFTIVLAQSGAAMSMQQANGGKLPPGVQPANVEFLKAHEADLLKLEQEMQQADSAAADTSGGRGR
ncbi:MAG TPA: hypothetical protein VFW98_10055 [Gemmatimonadaceae bacterium]|nr:hypothetical protein [Gemmatimonadaceae bacterium]